MDLQAAKRMNGRGWSFAKFAAFLCFAAACALLIGSLGNAPAAKAANGPWHTVSIR